MDSGMIGKIQKAKRYAQERERFHLESLEISVEGTNNTHRVSLADGELTCTCDFYNSREYCSHTMAIEEIMKGMEPIS
ncbi:MAG: hypothetical protein HN855_17035 [Anaerolineae bacterium]|jgi:hypothetical protein|nr:hypothetical protein [Anaerolineae bacterium]MBT7072672.1 hypothetical protein [Anaerolineae bacterium]MBT7326853.1 hypothetical protein [Anaerolineae bacterium]